MQRKQQGFTLIEILIVVAIIAILASVTLVGLGPTQRQGRDARRLSDLREVQTGLELYYNKNGTYPNVTKWSDLSTAITPVSGGVLPNDPTNNSTYYYSYAPSSDGSSYVIGATLEGGSSNSVFTGYNPPSSIPSGFTLGGTGTICTKDAGEYCLSL
jgi:prepilin-type N-terminal cleavage/methylation domain-containing protein